MLCYHGADPLASVDCAVEDDGRLGTLASAAPDVDTRQSTTLDGSSNSDNLRLARESSLKVSKELKVVGIAVVGGEPRLARNFEKIEVSYGRQTENSDNRFSNRCEKVDIPA